VKPEEITEVVQEKLTPQSEKYPQKELSEKQ
jgi:hypothetical protein